MPHGEPRCGNCGTSLISGSFHTCKPAWDEENAKLRAEVERLKEENWQLKASIKALDESKTEMFHAKESANLKVEAMRKWCCSACGLYVANDPAFIGTFAAGGCQRNHSDHKKYPFTQIQNCPVCAGKRDHETSTPVPDAKSEADFRGYNESP